MGQVQLKKVNKVKVDGVVYESRQKAMEALGMSQPTIEKAVKDLEKTSMSSLTVKYRKAAIVEFQKIKE